MIAESLRTLVNGTFHGVSVRWLSAYLDEARMRWRVDDEIIVAVLVAKVLGPSAALSFDDVRRHFGAFS